MTVYIAGTNATVPITSVALQGIIYGFSVCMYGITVWVLVFQRRLRGSYVMLGTATALWALSTTRMCIDITLTIKAFVDHISEGQLGPQAYLSTFSSPASLTDNAIYGLQTLIGDAVVIYRCYAVWNSVWVIIFPCLAWLGGLGSLLYILNMFASGVISGQRGLLIYIFTMTANVTATAALAYRIWTVDQAARKQHASRSSLRPVALIIIESGAIYTAILIVALITAMHALQVEYIINSIIPAAISVTFNMVFIRIAMSRIPKGGTGVSSTFPVSSVIFNIATSAEKQPTSRLSATVPPFISSRLSREHHDQISEVAV